MFRPALLALAVALAAAPAGAQNWREQYSPMPPTNDPVNGTSFPRLADIARRAAGGGGTLIGSDFDARSGVYRFKFINNSRVTWVDVDSHSGDVLNVEGR